MNSELNLENVLSHDCIVLTSNSQTKKEVIEELTDLLIAQNRVEDKNVFLRDVYEREELGSTGFENGIAIPHGKSAAVTKTSIAVARVKSPIEWDSLDEEPVDLIFLFAVASEDQSDNHVKLLATVSMVLCDDDKVASLKTCTDPEQFKFLISNN